MFNHFNRLSKSYFNNIGDKKLLYELIAKKIEPKFKNKIVLDIGNGGNFFYNYKNSKKITVLDPSNNMLTKLNDNKITKITQDARNMSIIDNKSIDTILICFVLHHINGPKYKDSIISLNKIINEAEKKLHSQGELIIVELTLNNFLFFIQKLFYQFTYFILSKFNTDMVFFYKDKIIKDSISINFKKYNLSYEKIKMFGWLDPLLGTFPGIIKIPSFLMPTTLKIFYVKKN